MSDTDLNNKIIILDTDEDWLQLYSDFLDEHGLDYQIVDNVMELESIVQLFLPDVIVFDPINISQSKKVKSKQLFKNVFVNINRDYENIKLVAFSEDSGHNVFKLMTAVDFYLNQKKPFIPDKKIFKKIFALEKPTQEDDSMVIEDDEPQYESDKKFHGVYKTIFATVNFKYRDDLYDNIIEYFKSDDETDPDRNRVLRQSIIKYFWKLYLANSKKIIKNSLTLPEQVFLRFRAILDPLLLTPDQMNSLLENISKSKKLNDKDIFYIDEYMLGVIKNIIPPVYNDFLLNEIRAKKPKNYLSKVKLNTLEGYRKAIIDVVGKNGMIENEVNTCIKAGILNCIGRTGNHFPILSKKLIESDFDNMFVSKLKIKQYVKLIESIDADLFIRKRGITIKRIMPYFIIVPAVGNFGFCWDSWHQCDRQNSRGRVILPILTTKHPFKIILTALANFRWINKKSEAGVYWMEDGLTGRYYEYFEDYKDKKFLKKDIKGGTREIKYLDKSLGLKGNFIKDYTNWIVFESKGQLKLNSIVRDIFWRYIPFPDNVKQNLQSKSTIYDDLLVKDKRRKLSRGY